MFFTRIDEDYKYRMVHAFKSVFQNRKSIYFERVCQEGIIRTMNEIHGSYYFLRKNISVLSFAESRDFKGILREIDSLTSGYITLKRYMKNSEEVEY